MIELFSKNNTTKLGELVGDNQVNYGRKTVYCRGKMAQIGRKSVKNRRKEIFQTFF